MAGSGWKRKQTENEMMTWAALPPAQTSCLASKPITLRESSLLLGVTGQTTRWHARTHAHTNAKIKSALQSFPGIAKYHQLCVAVWSPSKGLKKGKDHPNLFLCDLSAAVEHDAGI